ncbi:MAG TPA: UDP-N-acetylmuramoyl-L-alanyl-D-glutamate--2,6-diaminopimelate ligase [Gammaproteobacteria bacterium]|nr:UDP-N-acetylmuramoyl-L-alanyl-D-glutamate--2,6-diaminopimelate ligase [Gammaproteobacteria bacterium]
MATMRQESSRLSRLLEGYADIDKAIDCDINALSLDSRKLEEGALFFACAGTRGHGLDYLDQVCQSGVVAVAWEPSDQYPFLPGSATSADVPFIAIDDLSQRIGFIADRFYGHPSHDLTVIGITGTDGKTSSSHFLAGALNSSGRLTGLIGTLGYGLPDQLEASTHTTPDAINVHRLLHEMREQGAQYVVMEVSSHGLDQGRINGVIVKIAVLTNVSRDHIDYHGNEASYAKAKEKLFHMPGLKCVVINRDDACGRQWMQTLSDDVQVVLYGMEPCSDSPDNIHDLGMADIRLNRDGISWHAQGSCGEADLRNHLYGKFNVYNLAAVLATLSELGMPWADACRHIQDLDTVPGRMEFYHAPPGRTMPTVIIDFAHTPAALEQVLVAIREHGFGRVWCVFGCGGDRDKGKRPLMGGVAASLADRIVVTDDNPRTESGDEIINDIISSISNQQNVHVERDRKKAIFLALDSAGKNDVVLIAGKGHEDYQLMGERKLPFSDADVVRQWLNGGLH